MRDRAQSESFGRTAETVAAWWLRLHGWRIIDQRLRIPQGEIDLVAARGKTLAFVEVKARKRGEDLANATDRYRLRRVIAAAQALSGRYIGQFSDMRIDLILVAPWRIPVHLPDVVRP